MAQPPDPLEGIRLVSKKVLELRARWQQELATRATFEEQRLLAGEAFDFEPLAYPYCAHFSKTETYDPVHGRSHSLYVLCDVVNQNGDCAHHQSKP